MARDEAAVTTIADHANHDLCDDADALAVATIAAIVADKRRSPPRATMPSIGARQAGRRPTVH